MMPDPHHILFYDYVDDMVERRAPYREAHLDEIRAGKDDGRIVMAGPLGDPPNGARSCSRASGRTAIEAFAQADPYVEAGLVTAWRIEPWNLV